MELTTSLILSTDRHSTGINDSQYARASRRGELVRLRRGAYCETSRWSKLSGRQRHLLRANAVQLAAGKPIVLSGFSAAAVWGMPVLGPWPEVVHVLAGPSSGGRSKGDVRRHPTAVWPEVVERGGFAVTSLARTALDVALASAFAPAVGSVDWALWRRNPDRVTGEDLVAELERMRPRYRRTHADAVLRIATHLSDSFGESVARAGFHQLGYAAPELQVEFRDRQGRMIVDYFWREQGIAGEFDGEVKYQGREFSNGRSPGEIVWQEKKREDRLRRQCNGVARIVMAEALHLNRLDAVLREYGLRPERELARSWREKPSVRQ